MMTVLQKVLCLLLFAFYQHLCSAKVPIGVLFSETNNHSDIILEHTLWLNQRMRIFKSNAKQISNSDYLEARKTLCDVLQTGDGVAVIIDLESSLESSTSPILESICGQFDVPYIMTSWRPPTTKQTDTFLNFFPKAELLTHALAEIVKSLQWSSFVVIYETEEGFTKLQEILKLQNNILVKPLGRGPDYRYLLKEIQNTSINNIILDCKTEHIIPILKQAKDQNLLNSNNNYFLTSLDAHTLDYTELNTTANITIISLMDYNSERYKELMNDFLQLSTRSYILDLNAQINTIKTATVLLCDVLLHISDILYFKNITPNPVNCYDHARSKDGFIFAAWMKEDDPSITLSGPIKFDTKGNRIHFNLHVVDVLEQVTIANWYASNNSLVLRRNSSEYESAAVKDLQQITVHVSSRLGPPYLMYREAEEGEILHGNDRFEGYSMDLIREIANIVGFRYEFHLTESSEYGRWDEKQQKWTGLIGDILNKKAHIAVGDLTITHQRRKVVDFSIPFMTLGISILHKREEITDINMYAFLDPFLLSVWIYTTTLYLIVSILLYFISRIVPDEWENLDSSDENPEELKNIWDIKNSLWLTLGSLMTQGCDILPKAISSRTALSMWWFFSFILACSYTANLAAFLTKERMEPIIDSVEALAKQTRIKYGLLDGGSTMAFFKDSNVPTYQSMWANMISSRPSVFVNSNSEGVRRVLMSNGGYAFLMESTQIEYELETKCDLKQVGTFLDTKTYGIAMPLGAPYKTAINKAILRLQESGMLNSLKLKWWKEKRKEHYSCQIDDFEEMESEDLTLASTNGLFFILGIGIAIAIILAALELLWNVKTISTEEHLTYWETLKMELKFACNIWITKKRIKPVISNSSCSGR